MDQRNSRRVLNGVVVSNKMTKTVVIKVCRRVKHQKYGKLIEKYKKYYAHTEKDMKIGESVDIMECRPISKLKRWRVI